MRRAADRAGFRETVADMVSKEEDTLQAIAKTIQFTNS